LREESGNALVEMALFFTFIGIPMLIGTAQMGILIYDQIEVSNAANAGDIFGTYMSGVAGDTAKITAAAQAEASDFPSTSLGNSILTVVPTIFFYCAGAVGSNTPATASGATPPYTDLPTATAACSGPDTPNEVIEFLQVQTSATVTPLIHLPGLPSSITLTGNAVMEVQP
jgi:Flp pilus assembly protein TadG